MKAKKQPSSHRHRSNISIYKTLTASLPFIEVDLNLTQQHMSMLINGLKYVIPNQSRLCNRPSLHDILAKQYQHLSMTVKECLKDNRILITDERAKLAFSALERVFYGMELKRLSRKQTVRAQREYRIVRSIQYLLRQRPDIVVRRTDKSKVFYIGRAIDFARKSEEYMLKTEAYEEIADGRSPLSSNLSAVKTLLDYLVKKKALTAKQSKQISPNSDTVELGHYHGLPKPHKVNILS